MPNTEEYIGVVISDVARLLRTEFDRRVRRLGITRGQWLVLTRLHRRPGASHSELAEMMEVEKATAGRMIDRLVANGWVERRAQPGDRRVKRVYLTVEAERVHKRIWRVAEDNRRNRACRSFRAGEQTAVRIAAARQGDARCGRQRSGKRFGDDRRPECALRGPRRAQRQGLHRDGASAEAGAGWRARAGRCRRSRRLAAGRPPRHHRERLRQGGHNPDRK